MSSSLYCQPLRAAWSQVFQPRDGRSSGLLGGGARWRRQRQENAKHKGDSHSQSSIEWGTFAVSVLRKVIERGEILKVPLLRCSVGAATQTWQTKSATGLASSRERSYFANITRFSCGSLLQTSHDDDTIISRLWPRNSLTWRPAWRSGRVFAEKMSTLYK